METGENCPVWNHRSSAPPGPLPKKTANQCVTNRPTKRPTDKRAPPLSIFFSIRICRTFLDKVSEVTRKKNNLFLNLRGKFSDMQTVLLRIDSF